LRERGAPEPITVVCALAAPEGIRAVDDEGISVHLVTAAVDQHLNDNAHLLLLALQADDRSAFIECLYREARLRDGLCDGLLTPAMAAFARATQHRVAAKVCGAGGGGCMFLFGEDPDADALEIEAARHGLSLLQVMPSTAGCRSEGVERESLRPE